MFPVNESRANRQLGKTQGGRDGGGNLGTCTVAFPKSVNCQRATIQTPQGLDGKHGGEVFPLSNGRSLGWAASLNSGKTRGGEDGG